MNEILTIVEHQTIIISKDRDINNTIPILSYEDRELLFDIKYTDKKGKKRFLFSNNGKNNIKACSIVGSVSLKNGLTIEILPKFAKGKLTETLKKQYRETLISMIRVSNEKNIITTQAQSGKVSMGEMPLINYIIELFTNSLVNTLRQGLYQTYTKDIINTSNIRGNILVSKTIQNNFIDKSKVYCSYSKHSSNNILMQVFKTLSRLLMQDDNLSYVTKQNLYEIHLLLDGVDIINLKPQDFNKVVFNRLNDKYEILFNQASFIFNKYMPFSSQINSTPFWSILFSMDYLFEKFLAYLFKKSNISFNEQSIINCFENQTNNMMVSAKPDFIIENNLCVADAKWKLLQKDKTLYGLNAQNFWQLFSYMNLINSNEQVMGYFIVPKNTDEFDDEIVFNSIIDGNKSITIISIDFSLPFVEIVNNFYFTILNNMLNYKKKTKTIPVKINKILPIIEEKEILNNETNSRDLITCKEFNFSEFIDELEILNKYKNYIKTITTSNKIKFPNINKLKNIQNVTTKVFKEFIKENINREVLRLDNLEINSIPPNIKKLKKLRMLKIQNNNITTLPDELFLSKKLEILNVSNNRISKLPDLISTIALKELCLDISLINNHLSLINTLIIKYGTKIYYPENDNEIEYKIEKEILCKETNDLELLNEISKNKDNIDILNIIVDKTKEYSFKNIIKENDTIYTTEIMDRIAKYSRYYKNTGNSLMHKVAFSYRLSLNTREYLFDTYKDDINLLECLNNDSLDIFKHLDFKKKLLNRIEELKKPKIINSISKQIKNFKKPETCEYYKTAKEHFEEGNYSEAIEYLDESQALSKDIEDLRNKIDYEIGKSFINIKKELLEIIKIFENENRSDIKKFIKEIDLNKYTNLNFICPTLNSVNIKELVYILTYIQSVNLENNTDYIKNISEFTEILRSKLVNISSEQNKLLESNVLSWKDTNTGLIWETKKYNTLNNQHKYTDSKTILKNLNSENYAGFSDWRVPTLEELKTLITNEKNDKDLYIKKPLSTNNDTLYWTSTSNKKTKWMLNFKTKREENIKEGYHACFRCVRGKMV